jgi:type II secretory pathway component PulM
MQTNWNILKLKQKLRAWRQLLDKLPDRQRRLAWLGLGGLSLLCIYWLIIGPLFDLEEAWDQKLGQQRQLLAKYQSLAASRAVAQEAITALQTALAQTEKQFLSGENPAVASADLQDIIKSLAREHGVELTSAKTLPSREAGSYLDISVQVTLAARIDQLLTILYNLEHHKKLLFISELEINAPRPVITDKNKVPLQINIVISGVVPKRGVTS